MSGEGPRRRIVGIWILCRGLAVLSWLATAILYVLKLLHWEPTREAWMIPAIAAIVFFFLSLILRVFAQDRSPKA